MLSIAVESIYSKSTISCKSKLQLNRHWKEPGDSRRHGLLER
jgi:hypothetical protein